MIQLSYKQQIAFRSLSIIAGNALYALTVVLFLVPSGLITGGATGIALGVNRVLGLPVSGVLFAINISMLVLGWMVLGSRFALTTIASTILSPLFLALWERVFADFVLTDDLVLNTIFAGLGVGISLGITIRAGASTGGMDIPPLVLREEPKGPFSADAAQRHGECNAGARHVDAHFAAQVPLHLLPGLGCDHRQQHSFFGLFQPQGGKSLLHRRSGAHRAQGHVHTVGLIQLQKGVGSAAVGDGAHQKQRTHSACPPYSSMMSSSGQSA